MERPNGVLQSIWLPIRILVPGALKAASVKIEYRVFFFEAIFLFIVLGTMKLLDAPHAAREGVGIPLAVICLFIFAGTGMAREAREKEIELEKILTSSDLENMFQALSLRLNAKDANQLRALQSAMELGARQASELAEQIRQYKSANKSLQEQREGERKAAEAVSNLLSSEVGRVAEIIERRGRRSQWMFLISGAILGVVFQEIFQWIF